MNLSALEKAENRKELFGDVAGRFSAGYPERAGQRGLSGPEATRVNICGADRVDKERKVLAGRVVDRLSVGMG